MSIAEYANCEAPIGGDQVFAWVGLDYWVLIGGVREGKVLANSVVIEESGDGRFRANCTVVNPSVTVAEGKSFSVIWRGELIFAGLIRTVTIDADQAESAIVYLVEADGWDSILARRTITVTYNNKSVGFILRDAITTSGVNADGVTAGRIDDSGEIILAVADHVRMNDFVRDIGNAGGGVAYLNEQKQIIFRPVSVDVSPYPVSNKNAETIHHIGDIDNYRNREIVKVTGLDGTTTVTETRNDLAQQAIRVTDEGGSGIYENYQTIKHPTSSVTGELSILGQTVGFVALRTYARNARRVVVTLREPAPEINQLVTVTLPGFSISGTFIVMRKMWRETGGTWLYELEFWESSFPKLALESLLRIVGAGKAVVSISANVFPNVQLFSTPGSGFTWTVPSGVTSAQFTCYGGSGGGGGRWDYTTVTSPPLAFHCIIGAYGGVGGNSGKAVTITGTVPTNVYDIIVGGKGLLGNRGAVNNFCGQGGCCASTGSNGTGGGLSNAKLGAAVIAQGDPGLGGAQATGTTTSASPGANGANGGGIGDAVVVGGGIIGGTNNPASDGLDGLVEVRW